MKKIPVTVLSGYLGSGKTTLLNHLLNSDHGFKVAVVVNDMSEVNIDAELIKEGGFTRTDEKLVEMSNGCICCTLREDLLIEIDKLSRIEGIDYILIESSGISEPVPVAQTFTYYDPDLNIDLSERTKLDTMVTVVDANRFWSDYNSGQSLVDRQQGISEQDEREIADLLIDQIEFCNVLILNKCDLLEKNEIEMIERVLRILQPSAKIIKTEHGKVNPEEILNTGLFDFEQASRSAGWIKELELGADQHTPETDEYGISSFVYNRRLPFHSMRFHRWMTERLPYNVVRAKGFAWCATRNSFALLVEQAGSSISIQPLSYWVAALPEEQQRRIFRDNPNVLDSWDPEYGDRNTRLVFIGLDLDREAIEKELDECLLTYEEMNEDWNRLPDPFHWTISYQY
ncbi:cobalamin biosynthesis protein CobW [Heyndrickxia ginsengihumi]|uniref:Cobalamin biosynthesis protein CobW n=1 Tax=Heyndrickxia ginsengihumi TaxID=363870 RepID=A0A0A6VCK1_9BACI|nr:GTP-binding protein [Heyndrickxia ginsengihumi]KHD84264.1 cobalamin biosynthesis protein CobW [Heyndrickxia ginsengihumi]MBE6184207.1 GTP-binding protein [Bacillus sp. (in: firmicutes)]